MQDDLTLLNLASSLQALDGRLGPAMSQCEPPSLATHIPLWVKMWEEAERQWCAGEIDEALLTYRKALSLTRARSPSFRRYYYIARRQWAEQKLQENPSDTQALYVLGTSCRFLDDVPCYESAFRRLLSSEDTGLAGKRLLALYQLGMLEMARGNWAAAADLLAEAAEGGIPAPDVYLALQSLHQNVDGNVSWSLDLDDLGPTVRLQPDRQITPTGWRLLGYTLMPWSDIGFDVELEMLLFWQPPQSLSTVELPSSWFAVEDVLVQMLTVPNLAPDPGFEWIEAGDERFPFDHRGFYYHGAAGIAIVPAAGMAGKPGNQALRLTCQDGQRVGTYAGLIPVQQGYIYLQSVDYQAEPGASLCVGRLWYDTVRNIWASPLSLPEFFVYGQSDSVWTTEAAVGVPVARACAARIGTINYDATGAAMVDNMLFVELPDPPLDL